MVRFTTAIVVVIFNTFVAHAQLAGTYAPETHPSLSWKKCTTSGICETITGSVTLDANWRWIHSKSSTKNCYTGNSWDSAQCPDGKTCAANCALDGAAYADDYGITSSGSTILLKFKSTSGSGQGMLGSRVFLMANDTRYQVFNLLNQEISFDVDVSRVPCGFSGSLSLLGMDADGGMAKFPNNKAGAKYGTGYCNSKCSRNLKFINGEANVDGWQPSNVDPNAGSGDYGSCCAEMNVWEANSISAAYTAHPCDTASQTRCSRADCSSSRLCDADGCDFNPYRMGNTTLFGAGSIVNTASKMTVVTQFITDSGKSSGSLKEIRRVYIQNGQVIQNSEVNILGMLNSYNSISAAYCSDQKRVFGDKDSFGDHGGLASISKAMSAGMVLSISLLGDSETNMYWLDSLYPTDGDPSSPGVARGICPNYVGPTLPVEPGVNPTVAFSNIRVGDINVY